MNEDEALQDAIGEAFAGDFTRLKERSGLQNTDIDAIKSVRDEFFFEFEKTIKLLIFAAEGMKAADEAMEAMKGKDKE